ncbi:type IV pilus twitching motility protein PilT [Geothrix sp. PMB-07]|uniref:type IV pilus twitching motility protein PilT n=1 Tax=Geothrix sp. PMB-07 TaxID=3068640 RepID=UPI002741139E|nr:PilT/PilU family type 4a pilus ATPase [Geothrix sp. PMB-07]WLT33531.1 PilT/PilU family type 4a pilus ATPase [Geothrix sp. PMB-07]
MAQLDRLLTHVIARAGSRLELKADRKPRLELKSGETVDLLPNPLPAVMVDVLAGDVVPAELKATWQKDGAAEFDYDLSGQSFRIKLSRYMDTPQILAEHQGLSTAPAPKAPTPVEAAPGPKVQLSPTPAPAAAAEPIPTETPRPVAPEPRHPAPEPTRPLPRPPRSHSHPLAEKLFAALLERKGSDLHCTTHEPPLARIHGDMKELDGFGPMDASTLLEMMESLATPAVWQRFEEHNDADFAYAYEAGGCRLRVNFFHDRVGPGLVCRVIPNQLPDPDRLGLPDPVRRLATLAKGLVLVTGPTGSGKSTTLAAIVDIANQKRKDHILTIEDPIEFVHPRKGCLVNQREVGTHTDSFKTGLRAALREDPDVVLVGEMRDLETIAIALETAVTGHLVFGTLHTSSAIGTIDRIVDQFPADRQQQIRVMLADSLKCVISQVLFKRIGGGRVAALETLFITPAIANLIREGKNFQIASAMQTGRSYGQRLMNDAIIDLIQAKKVEPMEAYLKCPDKESFIASCKRAGIPFDLRLGEAEL